MKCRVFMLAGAALLLQAVPGLALTTTTTSVACSSTVKLQPKIDAVPAGTIATFVVSGTCVENITVPEGKTIIIKGSTLAAKITPATITLPAVLSWGDTTIQSMTVANPTGAADSLVQADRSAHVDIIASNLSAPNVGTVVSDWGGSNMRILNSRISGGTDNAIEASDGSDLIVVATPAFPAGPDGSKVVVSSAAGAAISCNNGAALAVRAKTYNSANGAVLVTNSKVGFYLDQCNASIVNKTSVQTNLMVNGIQANGTAVGGGHGSIYLRNIAIVNNAGKGLNIEGGSLVILASTIRTNAQGDMWLGFGTQAVIPPWAGASSLPDAFVSNKVQCFQSASTPSAKLVVFSGSLFLPAGKTLTNLQNSNPGCISVN